MKVILCCVLLCVVFATTSTALTCMTEKEKCEADQCCVQVGMIGVCKALKRSGDNCALHPLKHLLKEHVYKIECPCEEELKCTETKDGMIGKMRGTCEANVEE